MPNTSIKVLNIGQAGYRFESENIVVFIDPYLSNSIQEKEAKDLIRLKPIPIQPVNVIDADWVLITHEHRDHCDLDTLLPLSIASKQCRFIGPPHVVTMLTKARINPNRIFTAEYGHSLQLNDNLKIFPMPSAHPNIERDSQMRHRWLGYIMQFFSLNIYHAGDTSPHKEVINAVKRFGDIDVAFLPVNERNYFLDKRGIIGNMSIRETFQFAEIIGAKVLVPTHWDMFAINSVFKEEIEFLYERISPKFKLSFEFNVQI